MSQTQIEAKTRLTATAVTAAQHVMVTFKDGKEHKVSYYGDPGKYKGNFLLKSPGLPNLAFNKDSGSYIVYPYGARRDALLGPSFKTKTANAKEAYLAGIKKFWKAL